MPATSDPEHELPAEIYSTLRAFRRRALLTRAAGGMGSALIASALLLGAALLLDRFFFLSTGARLAVTRTALGGLLLVAAISLWRLFRPMRSAQLARRIEAAAPNLEEGLLSSVQIAALPKKERARFSTELLHSLFRSTTVKLQRVKAGTVIDFHPARRLLLASFVLWGAFAALAAFDPQALLQLGNRFFHPSAELPRPSTVILAVSPGNVTVATGDDVELRGQVVRGAPGSVALLVRPEDGEWAEYPILVPSLSRRFTTVQKRFEYRMRAGDFLSPLYEINVRDAPRPVSFQITFHYPTYTGRALETLIRPTGDMAPLRGTHVDVEITASEPLAKAALEFVAADASASQEKKAGAYRDLRVSGSRAKIEDLDVASPGFYRLLLAAPDGVTNGWRAEYSVRPTPDRPPRVEILDPRAGEVLVEPSSLLEIKYQAEDDNGVRALELVPKPAGRGPKTISLQSFSEPAAAPRQFTDACLLDLAGFGLSPGESLSLCVRARDGLNQEGQSAELTLRASFLPDPPEGPGWPSRLKDMEDGLRSVLQEWSRLLPAAGGDTVDVLTADPARAEHFQEIPETTLGLTSFIRQVARGATEAGRSIQVPSPNRRALEHLGRLLRQAAAEEGSDFWAESVSLSGRMKLATLSAKVPAERLYALHRAIGSHLEIALSSLRSIHRAERWEGALERCLLLKNELRALVEVGEERPRESKEGFFESALQERKKRLLVEATGMAAELTSLSAGSSPDGLLEASARRLLDTVVPQLDGARKESEPSAPAPNPREAFRLAAGVVASVSAELSQRYEREEKLASEARSQLEPEASPGEMLARFAEEMEKSPPDPRLSTSIILSLSEELDEVESMGYADLETTGDLSALRELVESLARESDARAEEARANRARLLQGLLTAYRDTGSSRRMGRAIQELHHIAGGEESLAWKLRGDRPASYRALRALARAQREILRAVAAARPILEGVRGVEGIQSALLALDESSRAMQNAFQGLTSSRRAEAKAGGTGSAPVAGEARRAARLVDEQADNLERIRATAFPEAASARRWLREQLGSLPEQMTRLAAAEREHATSTRGLSASANGQDFAAQADALFTTHEENRRAAAGLSVKARKEGDRLLSSGASVERLRAYDRAAIRLSEIASMEMLEASRLLRSARAADGGVRGGICLEAALREEKAAAGIGLVARALATVEADDGLRLSTKEIEDLLKRRTPDVGPPLDPTRIAEEARLLLEGTLKAAEALSAQLKPDPRKLALLELLRHAAEHFRAALELARKNDAPQAAPLLSAGRKLLEEAIQLARKIRGEGEAALAEAEETLKAREEAGKKAEKEETAEVSREVAAVYEELKKILELGSLQKEVASRFEELLGKEAADPSQIEDLKKKEKDLSKELGDRFVSLGELVELVSKLVLMDREGREIAAAERSLAAESQRGGFELLEPRQGELVARAQKVVKDFYASGFKLSAVLPLVLKAYLKAGDATEPLLSSMEEGRRHLAAKGHNGVVAPEALLAAPSKLLSAAERIDSFLGRLGDMRRQALEAIADEERGSEGANGGLLGIERARRDFQEAAQLLGQGDLTAASRAHDASGRSLQACAAALRSRASDLLLPAGEEGSLMSKVIDEEAARLGLAWQAMTRGEYLPPGTMVSSSAPEEMAYPAEFRDLVRAYLKSLREK